MRSAEGLLKIPNTAKAADTAAVAEVGSSGQFRL